MLSINNFKLQFITHQTEHVDYFESAKMALEGGCKWIQLRMKTSDVKEIESVALQIQDWCKFHCATFIIDDYVDLTKKIKADGVHLGKMDMPVAEARKILGDEFIIGGTANTFYDISMLTQSGADYIGLGPFRFTETKKNLSPILDIEGYKYIIDQCTKENITIPIVAIGGITEDDIFDILATGIDGIALSSEILRAENPAEKTRRIQDLLNT